MLAIKNNVMAENAARHLGKSYDSLARSVERLSSGLRINSARDDAAGLAVRELIRADIAQFRQGGRNAQDAISMLQTTEGAMQVIDDLLIRMKELAEQASTGSYSAAQRTIMDAEYSQLGEEITRIADDTKFNGISLIGSVDGLLADVAIHIGSTNTIDINREAMDADALSVSTTGVKESWKSTLGVTTTYGDLFIVAASITDTTADEFDFKFGAAGDQVTIDIGGYETSGITLGELVGEINTAWQGLGGAHATEQVAFARFDSTANQWFLEIDNPVAEAEAFTVVNGGAAIVGYDTAGLFTEEATGVSGSTVSLTTEAGAATALGLVTAAITTKDTYRAELGYMMNRLDAAVNILNVQAENLMAAESRISDVDVATEMAAMTRNQVLAQAGISMLSQANSMPQMALKLLG